MVVSATCKFGFIMVFLCLVLIYLKMYVCLQSSRRVVCDDWNIGVHECFLKTFLRNCNSLCFYFFCKIRNCNSNYRDSNSFCFFNSVFFCSFYINLICKIDLKLQSSTGASLSTKILVVILCVKFAMTAGLKWSIVSAL